ncbi:Histidinol dehydrogenase [Slackia heliotrinireducens]|uniref:Histidinol dehydrogenase n=1 Tax=Slackia heliotrinireducens (strain ATCC 29202 / DSM 20476 / NCTC 11029 / RHS 1) TaxID=471855 RepID=C7N6L3_SLAHD|nr:histidinol dehydrogenase [Slackia heliotrinireducens]ACV22548.1 histidinol dehydrogenase [Slackia heliotrinireducens DSM 20476]VEH01011.1 Histidinol dehydrogenase [Slackia heliotrinireducens]
MRNITLAQGEYLKAGQLPRQGVLPAKVVTAAAGIVEEVRERGDAALRDFCLKFDGVEMDDFRVDPSAMDAAIDRVDLEFVEAVKKAAAQIRDFHEREVRQSWITTRPDGTILGQKVTPLSAAGVYVPGGRAQYPSTVLMDVIPAKVAGVEKIVMVTPPQKEGGISPYTLAAAKVAGVDEIYAVGGAQAIAAVAYGTESIPKVDKIVGPGNAFVAAAKRIVSGDVGIDMVAGPSEVCVLADDSANPVVVAADLMAQAEHDPLAACYLVTSSAELAQAVQEKLPAMVAASPRAEITAASLDNEGVVIVAPTLDQAIEAVNVIAPEHLELHCDDAMSLLGRIKNAGAIFIGHWSSEPLGDYVAGPNHTLPTGGTAVFSNPLGVDDFVKHSSIINYTKEGLEIDGPAVQVMAQAEGLWAHALSVGVRRKMLADGEEALNAVTPDELFAIAWPRILNTPKEA